MRPYLRLGLLGLAVAALAACPGTTSDVLCVVPVTIVNEEGEEIDSDLPPLYRRCDTPADTASE